MHKPILSKAKAISKAKTTNASFKTLVQQGAKQLRMSCGDMKKFNALTGEKKYINFLPASDFEGRLKSSLLLIHLMARHRKSRRTRADDMFS